MQAGERTGWKHIKKKIIVEKARKMIIDFASFWQNTNNMKKATLYVLITITMLAILESCHQSYKKKLMLM